MAAEMAMYAASFQRPARAGCVRLIGAAVFWMGCALPAAHADTLADVRATLARLQGSGTLRAQLDIKSWQRTGEGRDSEETTGLANVLLEDSSRGLQITYGRDLLSRLETEERAREKDSRSKTPYTQAVREAGTSELRSMLFAANHLLQTLDKTTLKSERSEPYNGKPAKVLTLEMSQDKLSEKDRKYVNKFEGTIDLWVSPEGVPLASRSRIALSGRAFVVISFENKMETEVSYATIGDRLVAQRKESHNSSSGAGEKNESRTTKTLQWQSL